MNGQYRGSRFCRLMRKGSLLRSAKLSVIRVERQKMTLFKSCRSHYRDCISSLKLVHCPYASGFRGRYSMPDKASREAARVVLRLDTAIVAFRAGESTGLRALDSASRLLDDRTDDGISVHAARAQGGRRVPHRPDRVELAILTALADTYGTELLTNASLGYALRLVARHGGVAFVQGILWGESASDAQLSVMLTAARAAFIQISLAFPDVFLAEANTVIASFMPGPPGPSTSKRGGDRE